MVSRRRVRKVVLAIAVIATSLVFFGCGGGSPTAPAPPPPVVNPPAPTPVTTSFRVGGGLSGAPIAGASVRYGSYVATSDGGGQVSFTDLTADSMVSVTGVANAGYRDPRNTRYCGGDVQLWPNKPGDVDDPLTRELAYNGGFNMTRPNGAGITLVPTDAIQSDAVAMQALRSAATKVSALKIPIYVLGDQPGTAQFRVELNASAPNDGNTIPSITAGVVMGGVLQFRSLTAARYLPLVVHEVTRTLGISGVNPYSTGVMVLAPTSADYSQAEKSVLLLRLTRPVRALFDGDNDQMVSCSSR